MESSALLKPNVTQELINTIIHSMLFAAYATVLEVVEDSVVVQGSVCENLMPFTASAKVVYPTTAQVQLAFKPAVGDKVLVVGIQAYNDAMFTATVPIINTPDTKVQRYTLLGCVAIPLNIKNHMTPLRLSDGHFSVGGKKVQGFTINEGDDPVVRWKELDKELQRIWGVIKTHKHPVPDGYSSESAELATVTLNLANAASDVLAVPAEEEA